MPALERSCATDPGIFDLCPCHSWTIRKRQEIIKRLQAMSKTPEQSLLDYPRIRHECSFYIDPGYHIELYSRFAIDSGGLSVASLYRIRLPSPHHVASEPIFACPHIDMVSMLVKNQGPTSCTRCSCRVFSMRTVPAKKDLHTFWVGRHLRSCELPVGQECTRECRLTGTRYLQNEAYW